MSNGLFDLAAGIASNNPLTAISDAVANYRSLFGTRMVDGKLVPGEVDRAAQPLTSEWLAARAGADPESLTFMAGGMLSPSSVLKSGDKAVRKIVTRAERVPGAKQKWTGVDKIERANIDDRDAKFFGDLNKIPDNSFRRLGDLFAHEKLYALYPEAKSITVRPMPANIIKAQGDTVRAAFDPANNVMYLKKGLTPEQIESSVVHELNHFVQKREGLLPGTNVVDTLAVARKMKEEYAYLKSVDPKRAAVYQRTALKNRGIDLDLPEDKLSIQLYQKQQGEADAFASQKAFETQQRMRKVLTPSEMASTPPIELSVGRPINKDTIFEDIYGYSAIPDEAVDLGVSGTPGMRESVADRLLKGLL